MSKVIPFFAVDIDYSSSLSMLNHKMFSVPRQSRIE
jgi:hypothetical protein